MEPKKTAQQTVRELHPEARAEWVDGVALISAGPNAGGKLSELLGRGHFVSDAWYDAARVINPELPRDGW